MKRRFSESGKVLEHMPPNQFIESTMQIILEEPKNGKSVQLRNKVVTDLRENDIKPILHEKAT
jgi:hypothetical protein